MSLEQISCCVERDCSRVLPISDPFLEPVAALEPDGGLLLLEHFLLLIRQLLWPQIEALLGQSLVACSRCRHRGLIRLRLILYQGARVLRGASFDGGDYRCAAL